MRIHSTLYVALACLALPLVPLRLLARDVAPIVTIVEGNGTIDSAGARYQPAPGMRLRPCDIVRTGPGGLLQIEFPDEAAVVLGHDSLIVVSLPDAEPSVAGEHVLVSGWAKLALPKRDGAAPHRLHSRYFDVRVAAGAAVVHVDSRGAELFVERGNAIVTAPGGRTPVEAGRTYARTAGPGAGVLSEGARKVLVDGMPRAFHDTLPSLRERFRGRDMPGLPAGERVPPQVSAQAGTVPELRRCARDATVRRAQEALQRDGIAVGPVDGIAGSRTRAALREFQAQRGLAPSARLDAETLKALDIDAP